MVKVIFTYEYDTKEKDENLILNEIIGLVKELLDIDQYQCLQCLKLEVRHFVEFKTDKEARLKELWNQAQKKYNDIHGNENILEAFNSQDRIEYDKLDEEVNGV